MTNTVAFNKRTIYLVGIVNHYIERTDHFTSQVNEYFEKQKYDETGLARKIFDSSVRSLSKSMKSRDAWQAKLDKHLTKSK
jgi:hypothetical protein